jgi:serine protein kinase
MSLSDELVHARDTRQDVMDTTITLDDYLKMVKKAPTIAATAHERIYNMIMAQGHKPGDQPEEISYNFFSDELYGMDRSLERIVRYFDAASQGHEIRRRILMLWGPPGGAKSTIASMIKRGMGAYSQTEAGAVYAIEGCPMHEDPLHLVPEGLRNRVRDDLGVSIEGELCPVCAYRLRQDKKDGGFGDANDFLAVPIRRIIISETDRVGIGTFEPADPKTQSMEQLTGGIDWLRVKEFGSEAHPMALDWAGEFSKSNRGMFEAVEFLKLEKEFRNGFLSAAQEKQFKVPKFGYTSLDAAIVAHSNEAEYRAFMADPKNEALRDRLYIVEVPYNTRLIDEESIYSKLLTRNTRTFHIAPHTLKAAGMVAIQSRLIEHDGLGLMEKLKLYNGEETGEWKLVQIPELKRAAEHEGMTGLGPRAIINTLAAQAVNREREGATQAYLTPISAMVAIMEHIEHMDTPRDERDRLKKFVIDARSEIDRELKDEVRKAFVPAFFDQAQDIMENYLLNVEAYLNDTTVKDPITKDDKEPDEKLMRAIEEKVSPSSVPESAKDTFRQGVFVRIGMNSRAGRPMVYNADLQLGRAIEEHLFNEMRDVIRITVSKTNPDPQQVQRLNEVIRVLVEERGYTDESANDVVTYVGQLLNR